MDKKYIADPEKSDFPSSSRGSGISREKQANKGKESGDGPEQLPEIVPAGTQDGIDQV